MAWGLGCKYCAQYAQGRANGAERAPGVSSRDSVWVRCQKGVDGVLQKIDCERHGAQTDFHKAAQKAWLEGQGASEEASARGSEAQASLTCPTAGQIRLAIEVVRSPVGAQAADYSRRAELVSRSDSVSFPSAYNKPYIHERIVACVAKILRRSCTCDIS